MVNAVFPDLGEPNPTMLGVLPFYHIYGGFPSSCPSRAKLKYVDPTRCGQAVAFPVYARDASSDHAEVRPRGILPVCREVQGDPGARSASNVPPSYAPSRYARLDVMMQRQAYLWITSCCEIRYEDSKDHVLGRSTIGRSVGERFADSLAEARRRCLHYTG